MASILTKIFNKETFNKWNAKNVDERQKVLSFNSKDKLITVYHEDASDTFEISFNSLNSYKKIGNLYYDQVVETIDREVA